MTDGPAAHLLYADQVVKTYPDGDVHALNGVTLGVKAGQHVAITGPSGCGKSTLLNLLGVLDKPDAGEVYFRGEPLSRHPDLNNFRARQIGFVFQSFFLIPTLSARENVQVPMFEGPPRSTRERVRKADELLELVGMSKRADHLPLKLSIGERQRVALARALANDPAMLLADEPTGNLDSDNAVKVLDLFASLQKSRNLALVVVTHSDEVAERADRVIRMRDGRVVSDAGTARVSTSGCAS
ncbi:abc transporter (glutamine transport atp-binding protein) : ABC-type antimicrobial peptide transport system, ATPase component OS=Singulisphaera acidiphila (strain ATCC BAA-1392 / DSM 18658 / VKM B-2454 / MOB10) GN=Sinac_5572 PE=3 SV=1: ABC_tran [Gemmata massiliana]|uniref:ABC transporter domain-containing protein n=1 Tax=Gemmata massiliana TaxID=1210884 RepID=A0A6P2CV98_9BACT|nr:ABC transporter ATP-binding protein [Gemmata massiliana]VTR92306.1 abc transporter (glutamine transport atp-binding protein) : ABC-type antimicrobial peptide transport system, ATPase component OS=Singulisphaera acidiphila (strain ATCC BAA-1392 / DSM 18658 / VKM B-2454 / MOB10) GN=Sinac_5572 PE=3 SV=1: ABC_tran [Gemmata massiliana]